MTRPPLPTHGRSDPGAMVREARTVLADAIAILSQPGGARDRHRDMLAQTIALAKGVVDCDEASPKTVAAALLVLAKAFAAQARDSLHGANQLSQASQRAPTRADCDDGWARVDRYAQVAEAAAKEATRIAEKLDTKAAWKAASRGTDAAREARRIVDDRNSAYTFHASPGFSFGEGWYAAAAARLASVAIQVEPDQPQTAQALRFMRDAGLSQWLVSYRPRPRANKQLPEIVESAFRQDAEDAQRMLREAFLGEAPVSSAIVEWCDAALAEAPTGKKVLLWLRYVGYQPERNTTYPELVQLTELALDHGLVPILIGDALQEGELPAGALDMTLFWKLPLFQGEDMRRAQLQLFEHLKSAHGLVGQIGVTTAGMDGPALMGLPTLYLTHQPNPRMGRWVGAVPGYEEVVRDGSHMDRIRGTLCEWGNV